MQLAASGGKNALVPLTQGFVKCTDGEDGMQTAHLSGSLSDASLATQAAVLGLTPDADRHAIDSAYRHLSKQCYQNGCCVDLEKFEVVTRARSYCLKNILAPRLEAGFSQKKNDFLALYLLVGTDPHESRYLESSRAILDSVHRNKLLLQIQRLMWSSWNIPLIWGDEDVP